MDQLYCKTRTDTHTDQHLPRTADAWRAVTNTRPPWDVTDFSTGRPVEKRNGREVGVPRGFHGQKCSLSEQKGGMDLKRDQIWRKVLAFGTKGGNEHQKGPFLDEMAEFG